MYHPNIDPMKAAIKRKRNSRSTEYVRNVCKKFRSRLKACIAAKGGIFEE